MLAEGIEHREQHRHRERHRDDEGEAQDEDLGDHHPRQPLADQRAEFLGDLAQQHQAGQGHEGEDERSRQLADEIPAQQAHDQER